MALATDNPCIPKSTGSPSRKQDQTAGSGTTRRTLVVSGEMNVNASTDAVRAVVLFTVAFTLTMVEDMRVLGTNITIRVRFAASLRLAKTRFTLWFDDEDLRRE